MKTKILFCTLLFSVSLSTFVSCSSDETSKDAEAKTFNFKDEEADPDIRVKAVWTIGRKSKNCDGFGICNKGAIKNVGVGKINVDIDKLRESLSFYSDITEIDPNTIHLELTGASYEYVNEVYGLNQIVLEEDFDFQTDEFNDAFGMTLSRDFTFKAGKYTLTKNEETGYWGVIIQNNTL